MSTLVSETVWVVSIEHRHGTDMSVWRTEAEAQQAVAAYCADWWDEAAGDEAIPDDPLELADRYFELAGDEWANIEAHALASVQPSAEGRNNLRDVSVMAHHSSVHDGINVEIDAPTGTRVTVHLNDGKFADLVVPE